MLYAEQLEKNSGIGIYIDQDMFVPFSNEDRDYTMGFAVEFFWAKDEWYFWGVFNTRFVGYDALLQGQFKKSEVTYSYDEIEHVVYDSGVAITFGFTGSQLTLSANAKISDLKIEVRNQVWGNINFLYYF